MLVKSLNRLVGKAFDRATLRTVLIIPFVLQIVGTLGLVEYVSLRNEQKVVNYVASQLRSEISDTVPYYQLCRRKTCLQPTLV